MNDLIQKITEAREAYYNNEAIMSDAEYDALEDELRAIAPDHELLKKIGADPVDEWPKAKHKIPMGSLNKVQNPEQFEDWVKDKDKYLLMMEKLDGISIAVKFQNGKIVQAITRGNGETGDDITPNVKRMIGPCPRAFNGWLRGEILLFKDNWKKHFPATKNPRNAASGTAKRYDGSGCEHLNIVFYDVYSDDYFECHSDKLDYISHALQYQAPHSLGLMADEVNDAVESWRSNRDELEYEIDGMVIMVDNLKKYDTYGENNMRPRGAVAYKFPPEMKQTVVKSITWQVGRTGRVTPVAELEPVDIGGITIKRASLHTAKIALESNAGPGAKVIISRRNDIIPFVESVITESKIEMPDMDVEWDGEYLKIKNLDKETALFNDVMIWVKRLKILHWGQAFIKTLINLGVIQRLSDIYSIDWKIVAAELGDGVALRAKKSIESKTMLDFKTFISALNLRHCDSSAKLLVKGGVDTLEKLIKITPDQLSEINGIGPTKASLICLGIINKEEEIKRLSQFLKFEENKGKLEGKSFCITGALSKPRKTIELKIVEKGGEIRKSVTKTTNYLVTNTPDSGTSKNKKAQEFGTKIITENQLFEMF